MRQSFAGFDTAKSVLIAFCFLVCFFIKTKIQISSLCQLKRCTSGKIAKNNFRKRSGENGCLQRELE